MSQTTVLHLGRGLATKLIKSFLFAAGVLSFQGAQAQLALPWYEPFAYQDDILSPNAGNASSAIWNMHGSGDTGSPQISILGAMTYSGLQYSNNTSGCVLGATGSNRNRGALLVNSTSGALYASFLLNVQSAPSGNRLIVSLSDRTSTSDSSPASSSHGVWVNGSRQLLISKRSNSSPNSSATSALSAGNHLVVMRYTFNTGSTTDDEVALWVDPDRSTFGGSAPTPALTSTTGSDTAILSSFWIIQINTAALQANFSMDEIRVGTSWAEAVPAGPTPAPSVLRFTTNSGYTTVGAPIGPVAVQVYDQYGYEYATSGVPVTVSVSSGTLGGTVTKNTDAAGKVSFTNLTAGTSGAKQLFADGAGLSTGESFWFTILPGGAASTPVINQAFRSGNNVVLRGANGSANQPFNVLASGSLATPRSLWTNIGAFNFQANGAFDCTNPVSGASAQFFALSCAGGSNVALPNFGKMGFVNSNNITGGAGGQTVIVSNYPTLAALCRYRSTHHLHQGHYH